MDPKAQQLGPEASWSRMGGLAGSERGSGGCKELGEPKG